MLDLKLGLSLAILYRSIIYGPIPQVNRGMQGSCYEIYENVRDLWGICWWLLSGLYRDFYLLYKNSMSERGYQICKWANIISIQSNSSMFQTTIEKVKQVGSCPIEGICWKYLITTNIKIKFREIVEIIYLYS